MLFAGLLLLRDFFPSWVFVGFYLWVSTRFTFFLQGALYRSCLFPGGYLLSRVFLLLLGGLLFQRAIVDFFWVGVAGFVLHGAHKVVVFFGGGGGGGCLLC